MMKSIMSALAIFLAIFIMGANASNGIQDFLIDNGHHSVDIFYNSSQWHMFQVKYVFVSRLHIKHMRKANRFSFGIFVFDGTKDDLASYLSAIKQRPVKMSLLAIYGSWNNKYTNLIKKYLLDMKAVTTFYILIPASHTGGMGHMTWHQITSLKSGSTISNLTFHVNSTMVVETFDLQGLEISSTSLTWDPYLIIDGCNEQGLECANNYGYCIDIMEELAFKYNFTYTSQKNVDNNWGNIVSNGTFSQAGGVMGDIANSKYDMSIRTLPYSCQKKTRYE